MPGSSTSYRVAAVYYTDNSDVAMRSKLVKVKQSEISVIILHHYNVDEVLHIFTMVSILRGSYNAVLHRVINVRPMKKACQ